MKVSLNWLNNYIEVSDYRDKPEELAQKLTFSGLEVDAIENFGKDLENVVVGHIKTLEKHPDADKLTLCQVDLGKGNVKQIICGAKNHKQGDKVVVAQPGAILPGAFKIKVSKIRGVESHGMLCSESELGFGEQSEGILILPPDVPQGKSYAEYTGLDDIIFDIYITTNRADCMGHIGIARELSCLLERPLKTPQVKLKTGKAFTKSNFKLQVKDSERCPRYAGRAISGVQVGPSPRWLIQALKSVGLKSINNVVDVTNFVLMEYGQPLHAFDARFLEGSQIIVDRAKKGEEFETLDETKIKFSGDELTIRDAKKPVALAGVVGGLNSGVLNETKDLFIESAHFSTSTVRKASRRFNIQTDSAARFAKGSDPEIVLEALDRACDLIRELAGGEKVEVASDFYDEYPKPYKAKSVLLKFKNLEERLGYSIDKGHVHQVMQALCCEIVKKNSEGLTLVPPSFRWDLFQEIDFVEEYARLHGYKNIPESLPPLTGAPLDHDINYIISRNLTEGLVRTGFSQVINYHFLSGQEQDKWLKGCLNFKTVGLEESAEPILIKNPLSEEYSTMRSSLFGGLFKNLLTNYRNGQDHGRIFELGPVFCKDGPKYVEPYRLSLMAWGHGKNLWTKDTNSPVVYDIKVALENLLEFLNIKQIDWVSCKSVPYFLHPNQSAYLFFEGSPIGYLGTLHPSLNSEYKIRENVAVCEVDVQRLMRGFPRKPQLRVLSKYPLVQRDVAFILRDDIEVGELLKHIKKISKPSLYLVEIIDDYRGEPLKENEHSVTFRLIYQELNKTLNEKELAELQKKLTDDICKKFSIELR